MLQYIIRAPIIKKLFWEQPFPNDAFPAFFFPKPFDQFFITAPFFSNVAPFCFPLIVLLFLSFIFCGHSFYYGDA